MPRHLPLRTLASLAIPLLGQAVFAEAAASKPSLLQAPVKEALVARRKAAESIRRRNLRRADKSWQGLGQLGRSLLDFGPRIVVLAEEDARRSISGYGLGGGARLVHRLILLRQPAGSIWNGTTGQQEQVPERYQPGIEERYSHPNGSTQQNQFTLGTPEEVKLGRAQFEYKQFGSLVGSFDGRSAANLAEQARVARSNWTQIRKLAKELGRNLRPNEEVFLLESMLPVLPNGQMVSPGMLIRGQLVIVRQPLRNAVPNKKNPQQPHTPWATQLVLRARVQDKSGTVIQEQNFVLGTKQGFTDLPPRDLIDYFAEVSVDKAIANANRSLAEIIQDAP